MDEEEKDAGEDQTDSVQTDLTCPPEVSEDNQSSAVRPKLLIEHHTQTLFTYPPLQSNTEIIIQLRDQIPDIKPSLDNIYSYQDDNGNISIQTDLSLAENKIGPTYLPVPGVTVQTTMTCALNSLDKYTQTVFSAIDDTQTDSFIQNILINTYPRYSQIMDEKRVFAETEIRNEDLDNALEENEFGNEHEESLFNTEEESMETDFVTENQGFAIEIGQDEEYEQESSEETLSLELIVEHETDEMEYGINYEMEMDYGMDMEEEQDIGNIIEIGDEILIEDEIEIGDELEMGDEMDWEVGEESLLSVTAQISTDFEEAFISVAIQTDFSCAHCVDDDKFISEFAQTFFTYNPFESMTHIKKELCREFPEHFKEEVEEISYCQNCQEQFIRKMKTGIPIVCEACPDLSCAPKDKIFLEKEIEFTETEDIKSKEQGKIEKMSLCPSCEEKLKKEIYPGKGLVCEPCPKLVCVPKKYLYMGEGASTISDSVPTSTLPLSDTWDVRPSDSESLEHSNVNKSPESARVSESSVPLIVEKTSETTESQTVQQTESLEHSNIDFSPKSPEKAPSDDIYVDISLEALKKKLSQSELEESTDYSIGLTDGSSSTKTELNDEDLTSYDILEIEPSKEEKVEIETTIVPEEEKKIFKTISDIADIEPLVSLIPNKDKSKGLSKRIKVGDDLIYTMPIGSQKELKIVATLRRFREERTKEGEFDMSIFEEEVQVYKRSILPCRLMISPPCKFCKPEDSPKKLQYMRQVVDQAVSVYQRELGPISNELDRIHAQLQSMNIEMPKIKKKEDPLKKDQQVCTESEFIKPPEKAPKKKRLQMPSVPIQQQMMPPPYMMHYQNNPYYPGFYFTGNETMFNISSGITTQSWTSLSYHSSQVSLKDSASKKGRRDRHRSKKDKKGRSRTHETESPRRQEFVSPNEMNLDDTRRPRKKKSKKKKKPKPMYSQFKEDTFIKGQGMWTEPDHHL